MPSDILTRLTQPRRVAFHNMTDPLCEEAAAIITALEAENASLRAEAAKLRESLTEVMNWISNWDPNFVHDDEWPATRDRARAALGGGGE